MHCWLYFRNSYFTHLYYCCRSLGCMYPCRSRGLARSIPTTRNPGIPATILVMIGYFSRRSLCNGNDCCSVQDFLLTLVLAMLWFISAACWARHITDLKKYTSPAELIKYMSDCQLFGCDEGFKGNFSSLNVSVVSLCVLFHVTRCTVCVFYIAELERLSYNQ